MTGNGVDGASKRLTGRSILGLSNASKSSGFANSPLSKFSPGSSNSGDWQGDPRVLVCSSIALLSSFSISSKSSTSWKRDMAGEVAVEAGEDEKGERRLLDDDSGEGEEAPCWCGDLDDALLLEVSTNS